MKMKVEEMPRASEGDVIELEGKVFRLKAPNSNDFDGEIVWGQFIVLKDDSGEQGCWLKLDSEEDKVTKGTSISIKGKLGKEYTTSRGKKARSINGCDFEVVGKMQAPAQSSAQSSGNGDGKVDDKVWKEKDLRMARESALKNVTQFVVAKIVKLVDRFKYAQEDVDFIYKDMKQGLSDAKEERIEKAEEIVSETRFKPASTEQKKYIYGYRNNEDKWCMGIIESRYITKPEIREIGDPKKLSLEKANEKLDWWWGPDKKTGERAKREKEAPRDKDGNLIDEIKESDSIVKGDKTSLVKDDLIDDINAWRRENFLSDDKKFKEELGYNPNLEKLSEEDLLKIKKLTKNYHPKSWNGDEKQ